MMGYETTCGPRDRRIVPRRADTAFGSIAHIAQTAGVPEESVTPALWAQQSGIFRRAGLDVDIRPQNSGSAIAAGVAGGSYAIGKSSLVSLIIAHSKGLPFVLIAGGGLYDAKNPNVGLLVKADSPMKNAADLNGKMLGVSNLNDLYTLAAKAWLDSHGGDSTSIKTLEFPIAAIPDAIAANRIDAGGLIDPELQSAVDSKKVRVFARMFDAVAPRFMYTGWFTTTDFLAKNRATVEAFSRAMRESTTYVNSHESETVDMLSKFTSIEPSRIAKMHRISYSSTLDPRLIQPSIDVCAKYKAIPASFDAKELIAPGIR